MVVIVRIESFAALYTAVVFNLGFGFERLRHHCVNLIVISLLYVACYIFEDRTGFMRGMGSFGVRWEIGCGVLGLVDEASGKVVIE